jgi:hypothetical protein
MADRLVRDENDGGVVRRDVDMGDGTWAERGNVTSDLGNPGFFRGREFRSFYEFSTTAGTQIPANNRILFRAALGASMLLESLELSIDDGQVRVTSHAGGTPTGAFVTTLPIIAANSIVGTPVYTPLVVLSATAAGLIAAVNITGSSLRDVVRVKTPAGGGASNSENSTVDSVRGLPTGATFYILVENLGAGNVEGTLRMRWQEPAGTA